MENTVKKLLVACAALLAAPVAHGMINEWHAAIEKKDLSQVRGLIAQGKQNILESFTDGYLRKTPLHMALGKPEIMKLLLEGGADPNIPDSSGMTPLYRAGICKIPGSFCQLLDGGANPNTSFKGETILQSVVQPLTTRLSETSQLREAESTRAIAGLLLDYGADVNARVGSRGKRALHFAIFRHDLALLDLFLKHGAQVNATDDCGSTALHSALSWADYDKGLAPCIVHTLLNAGADPNLRSNGKYGRTLIDNARERRWGGSKEAFEELLSTRAAFTTLEECKFLNALLREKIGQCLIGSRTQDLQASVDKKRILSRDARLRAVHERRCRMRAEAEALDTAGMDPEHAAAYGSCA